MERRTPIMDALYSVCEDSRARFCMPGHKGDTGFFGGELLKYDVTELTGLDNLMSPHGAIKESQDLHAEFIGASAVHYTTGGSTTGVLAMLSLFAGKKVVFPRGIHISAANAITLFDIRPIYLPSRACDYPALTAVEDVKKTLLENRDAAAVFMTYPNYFGLCSDIASIAGLVHKMGIPLLVDGAHSAHFDYSPLLPLSPSDAGADVWTQSAHKTLPAMNQCACICLGKSSLISSEDIKRSLTKLQTSSPSYLLLASLDYAHAFMRDKGEQELFRVIEEVDVFRDMINKLPLFSIPCIELAENEERDPLKLIIDVSASGHTGMSIKKKLELAGIQVEAADTKNILLLLTVGDTIDMLDILYDELKKIEKTYSRNIYFSPYSLPFATKYSPKHKQYVNIEKVRIERAVGRTSASTVCVFPPAEVVVHAGQQISFEISGYLLEAKRQGYEVIGISDTIDVYGEII